MLPFTDILRKLKRKKAVTPERKSFVEKFLTEERRVGILGTCSPNGQVHISPVWFLWKDGNILISITKETRKYGNLTERRDPKMTFSCYKEPLAQDYLTLWGIFKIREEDIWEDTKALCARYIEPEDLDEYMEMLYSQNRVLVEFKPTQTFCREDGWKGYNSWKKKSQLKEQ